MSVLSDTKQLLGITSLDDYDDTWNLDILTALNTSMAVLFQLGVPFVTITDETEYTDLATDPMLQSLIKSYLFFKTKKQFDPSQSTNAVTAMNDMIAELESRIGFLVDPGSMP